VKIKEVLVALEQFAPLPLQEDYDNAGLQVGLTEAEVSGALLCLDVNEAIVQEAIQRHCNLIVAHHPLIFHPLRRIAGQDYVQKTVALAIKNDITIVAMHTNLDSARGGVNYKIAEKIGLTDVQLIGEKKTCDGIEGASGIIGTLPHPTPAAEFIATVKQQLEATCAHCNELLRRPVSRVAICGGAGAFVMRDAIREKADAFITGEMHYHEFFGTEQQLQIVVLGHYETEHFTSELLRDIIQQALPDVPCCIATTNTNPIINL